MSRPPMIASSYPEELTESLQRIAGYLNFSSGPMDVGTLAAWNRVYAAACHDRPLSKPTSWLVLQSWIGETIDRLSKTQAAFARHAQADRIIRLTWTQLLPAYLDFHRDLLFHQTPELLFNGFFLAKAAEAVLRHDGKGDDQAVVDAAIETLNDFVGYRPVAVLENHAGQPYAHEFVHPLPLHLRGVGTSAGPYHDLISLTIQTLQQTDPEILRQACFDPECLDVLALDVRAYDFDHPVNRRPNYHFGQWDDRSVGLDGRYHRFVIRQVTLDALLQRPIEIQRQLAAPSSATPPVCTHHEAMIEAAAVLAGTILMASGISGWGPDTYGSDVQLSSLMKPIARYRDAFYEDRLRHLDPSHRDRLMREQATHHQPFGAVRQYLNAALAKRRASQVQHAQLARLYARMGYPTAAKKQSDVVAAASARMTCRIDCQVAAGLRAVRNGDLPEAVRIARDVYDLLKRSIHCGALIDPWNLLGFGGNFSLFPGPESSIHDNRVEDLIAIIDQMFSYAARVWSEAAARDDADAYSQMESCYREMAQWWRQFAAHTVQSIEAIDPLESYESAKLVSRALRLWHRGGAAAGDVKFWAPHADLFDSSRAYALVITALLERRDFVPAMALLVHWLSNAHDIGLSSGPGSLPRLSERWLLKLRGARSPEQTDRPLSATLSTQFGRSIQSPAVAGPEDPAAADPAGDHGDGADGATPQPIWPLVRKLFDYYEANAQHYWSAPVFELGSQPHKHRDWELEISRADQPGEENDDGSNGPTVDENPFAAAYEDMVYQDTTDDGNDGAVFQYGDEGSRDELQAESKRLTDHLNFLQSLARMWAVASDVAVVESMGDPHAATRAAHDRAAHDRAADDRAAHDRAADDHGDPPPPRSPGGGQVGGGQVGGGQVESTDRAERLEYLQNWADRAKQNRIGLLELLDAVQNYKVSPIGTDKESLRSYDRLRLMRDSMMERIITAAVEISDARRLICGAIDALSHGESRAVDEEMAEDDAGAIALYSALIAGNTDKARLLFPVFLDVVHNKSLLYIPLSRGGDPVKIYVARLRQRVLRHLVHWLPRRGLLVEACRLIETARMMEQQNPIGVGAVTEFDGMFAEGFRAIVLAIVRSVQASVDGDPSPRVLGEMRRKSKQRSLSSNERKRTSRTLRSQEEAIARKLIPALEKATEILLGSWLAHSQTLRLSPLETVTDPRKWEQLVQFIRSYGDPVFTQTFLQLGNVRAVLHQGVTSWLDRALRDGDDQLDDTPLFLDLIDGKTDIATATRWITLVYEAVLDHHSEYLDYNSTTTQSDRGDFIYMLLDFLRLRVRYERIAWNLKPVMWAHEVLVHAGLEIAAKSWRRSLSERIGAEAEIYVQRLQAMQAEYAMRMPTVADRIMERFSRPMTIDRMRALVAPALADTEAGVDSVSFEILHAEAELLAQHPAGVGHDVPAWLTALEDEVEKLAKRSAASEIDPQELMTITLLPLSHDDLQDQLNVASRQGRRLPFHKP